MNVTLPNGTVIQNVPDGTSKEAVMQKAIAAGLATEADFGIGGNDNAGMVGAARPEVRPDIGEAGAVIGSSILAEPVAGLAGLASAPFVGVEGAVENIESVRDALTYEPKREGGQVAMQKLGEALAPVSDFIVDTRETLGDAVFKATGSPALAAAAYTAPDAILEVIGVKGMGKIGRGFSRAKSTASKGKIARAINQAAPSVDQLKDTARAVYKEIDDLGVSLKPNTYMELVKKLERTAERMGIDPDVTPKAQKALDKFADRLGGSPSLGDVEIMRRVAQNAADVPEGAERAIGTAMVVAVDDFLDKVSESRLRKPPGVKADIGRRYKIARDLWGRAKRTEMLEQAFETARNQASGFENGIRIQFRQILNNKNKVKYFKPDELRAMRRVVRGTGKENIARLVGKLGFSEGSATQLIGGSLGVGAGAYVGGPVGAVAVPLVGQVSKKLAQRMTINNAEFANQVIRAGKNANKITEAYLRFTPKAQRSAAELSELLMRQDIDLSKLRKTKLAEEAAMLTTQRRAELAGALAPTALTSEDTNAITN